VILVEDPTTVFAYLRQSSLISVKIHFNAVPQALLEIADHRCLSLNLANNPHEWGLFWGLFCLVNWYA
jgi:hypothetical protein